MVINQFPRTSSFNILCKLYFTSIGMLSLMNFGIIGGTSSNCCDNLYFGSSGLVILCEKNRLAGEDPSISRLDRLNSGLFKPRKSFLGRVSFISPL